MNSKHKQQEQQQQNNNNNNKKKKEGIRTYYNKHVHNVYHPKSTGCTQTDWKKNSIKMMSSSYNFHQKFLNKRRNMSMKLQETMNNMNVFIRYVYVFVYVRETVCMCVCIWVYFKYEIMC